jgi:hypothetical protein
MKALKIIGWVVLGLTVAAAIGLGLGVVVMLLWNWVVPALFGLPRISFWQAVGLFVLCHLLFKAHVSGRARGEGDGKDKGRHKFASRVRKLMGGGSSDADVAGESQPKEA